MIILDGLSASFSLVINYLQTQNLILIKARRFGLDA